MIKDCIIIGILVLANGSFLLGRPTGHLDHIDRIYEEHYTDLDSLRLAIHLSRKIKNPGLELKAYNTIGFLYADSIDLPYQDTALKYLELGENLIFNKGYEIDLFRQGDLYYYKAMLHYKKMQYALASHSYEEAGNFYKRALQKEDDPNERIYFQGLLEDTYINTAKVYLDWADLADQIGPNESINYNKTALAYFRRSLIQAKQLGEERRLISTLNYLAMVHRRLGEKDSALIYLVNAEEIFEQTISRFKGKLPDCENESISECSWLKNASLHIEHLYGQLAMESGQSEQAKENFSNVIFQKIDERDPWQLQIGINSLFRLGNLSENTEVEKAMKFYLEALEIIYRSGKKVELELPITDRLAKLYLEVNQLPNAKEMFAKSNELREKALARILEESRFISDLNKELELKKLIADSERDQANQRSIFIAILGTLILIGAFLYNKQRIRIKERDFKLAQNERQLLVEKQMRFMWNRVEEEREKIREKLKRRMAYKIHSDWGQKVNAAKLNLIYLKELVKKEIYKDFDEMIEVLKTLYKDAQALSKQLHAEELREGLFIALHRFVLAHNKINKRTPISLFISPEVEGILPAHLERAFYRLVQEGVTNALKHASARNIEIEILLNDSQSGALLKIKDDGSGFNTLEVKRGIGTEEMEDIAKDIGGRLHITSVLGKGVCIELHAPLEKPMEEPLSFE